MLYINFVPKYEEGVKKKIYYQIKSLEKENKKIIISEIRENILFLGKDKIGRYSLPNTKINLVIRKIQEIIIFEKLKNKERYKNLKVIYIRYIKSSPITLSFYKFAKKNGLKIIVEIPTYPYDNEIKKQNIFTVMDRYYRTKLYKYVDKIVTYSEDKEIWGIPCINISNGIDLDEVKVVNRKEKKSNKIVFTSVSNCSFWHGIDRILFSLEKYGKLEHEKDIEFNIVGEGAESNRLKEIVSKSEYLSKIINFQGFKTGKELDSIYDRTHIGVGSLARHRSGLHVMRTLKNREYVAKGLTLIYSEDDPDLREVPFVYHITPDEELIDIEKIIKWHEQVELSPKEIREYANQFSWDIQMKKVIEEIEKNNN